MGTGQHLASHQNSGLSTPHTTHCTARCHRTGSRHHAMWHRHLYHRGHRSRRDQTAISDTAYQCLGCHTCLELPRHGGTWAGQRGTCLITLLQHRRGDFTILYADREACLINMTTYYEHFVLARVDFKAIDKGVICRAPCKADHYLATAVSLHSELLSQGFLIPSLGIDIKVPQHRVSVHRHVKLTQTGCLEGEFCPV